MFNTRIPKKKRKKKRKKIILHLLITSYVLCRKMKRKMDNIILLKVNIRISHLCVYIMYIYMYVYIIYTYTHSYILSTYTIHKKKKWIQLHCGLFSKHTFYRLRFFHPYYLLFLSYIHLYIYIYTYNCTYYTFFFLITKRLDKSM